ncbi:hypothetical protein H310_03371 [Aphanomyces invadans]|uniref:FYVE-type domain-containing protein n=1 Tax=Aphanomyces invadans TaxID=157072 RepID=A0A024UGT9_9STRA|nr:hypothetical protein H310_03371 [Aphanomyces invadans]ETW05646.1 hypothetical protein H310_03371 [Aphanomyces invadans]|eukprot:XP_008865423.1 hypothetical protein H310_03371 [Aphanomyces invadans]
MSNTPMSIGAKAMSQPNLVRGQSVEINLRAIGDATKNSVIMIENFKHQDDWVSNSERSRCHICTKLFGAFRRKHHCRVCGEVVCSSCTLKKQVMLPMVGQTEARVCVTCVLAYCKPIQSGNGSFAVDGSVMSPVAYSLPSSGSSRDGRATTHSEYSRHNNTQLQSPDVMGSHGDFVDPTTYFQSEPSPFDYALDFDWEHPWPKPPVPVDESHRLDVLRSFDILGTPQEDVFDIICDLVSKSLNCPIAAVSFIDQERQWYKASVGLIQDEIPRNVSFCAHILYTKQSIVVPDTTLDKRFDRNPLVTGRAGIRFYAAAPIISPATGYVLGTVFVFDNHPRPRDQVDLATLEKLAGVAMKNLEDRRASVASSSAAFDHHSVHRASTATERMSIVTSVANNDAQSPHITRPSATGAQVVTPTSSVGSDATTLPLPALPRTESPPSSCVVSTPSAEAATPTAVVTSEPPKMETMLMNLLSQTTMTQQQLAKQQGSMYATLSGHSSQIDKLAQAVARMEAKLGGGALNGASTLPNDSSDTPPDDGKEQQPGEKE